MSYLKLNSFILFLTSRQLQFAPSAESSPYSSSPARRKVLYWLPPILACSCVKNKVKNLSFLSIVNGITDEPWMTGENLPELHGRLHALMRTAGEEFATRRVRRLQQHRQITLQLARLGLEHFVLVLHHAEIAPVHATLLLQTFNHLQSQIQNTRVFILNLK